MGFINVFVSAEAYLCVKNNQLFLKNDIQEMDYPLEDINSVLIENLNTTISTYTLFKLADNGIVTFVCDQNHLPCGVVLPFCSHYQTLVQFNHQIGASKPLKKQIWQSVVVNKIENQNTVLNMCGGNDDLKQLAGSVLSGDSGNNEAKASLTYFRKLFDKNFVRRDESVINGFLNYGYAIVRGFVARSVVVHGLTPFLGVFHCNGYNQFNLADDLMEVFRPLVDLFVKVALDGKDKLDRETKMALFGIVNIDVLIDGQKQTVGNAVDMLVESYAKSLKENRNVLKKVEICGLDRHKYE